MIDVWRSLDDVPSDLARTVVTVGNFDGVHLGHQHVVRRAREVASDAGVERVVAVTFDPHPMAVLRPEHAPIPLTSVEERVVLLEQAGVDSVLVVPFSREIATWSPEHFVRLVLVDTLHARVVVVGANFRFGNRAAGNVHTLRKLGVELDFGVEGIPLDGGPQVWSSTYVRSCLSSGDVQAAAQALGRRVTVRGVVVEGEKRGRELGYPTANVPAPDLVAVPADGVYAGWLRRLDTGQLHPAAISVGTNPTFAGERARRVESYVLPGSAPADLELYGVEVEVTFVARIRGMVSFDSVADLMARMHDDVRRTRELLEVEAQPT
ncbi:bifunctional riboflavin kinase/FAD synthetase [soil metagenome]